MTEPTVSSPKKKSLILAGGGLKVAFQAGVMQVWLDEADLTFDHADGASGGVFNLAMYCQGMTGREIADNWRAMRPLQGVQPNWSAWLRGPFGISLLRFDRYRTRIFRDWQLDWDKIRSTTQVATFNAFNFTRNKLDVRAAKDVNEDFIAAAVCLPMWFPPVIIDGDTYVDAVYITDANLEAAIERGADELWIIWTVSRRQVWRPGFVSEYFQTIEIVANGNLQRILERIEANNQAIGHDRNGEFGRHITVKMLSAEVPLNYLINVSGDRFAEAVELGVRAGRKWCRNNGVSLKAPPADNWSTATRMSFTEQMAGFISYGERGFIVATKRGRDDGNSLKLHLNIAITGVSHFVFDPDHEAEVAGWVDCESLGGRRPVEGGSSFNLLVEEEYPGHQRMRYRIFFSDGVGHPLTLVGFKEVRNDNGADLWRDTTTLYTTILRGHVDEGADAGAVIVACGVLRLRLSDFARQLATFRAQAPTLLGRADVLVRFGQLFLGKLWDVYAQEVLPSSPV